MRTIFIGCSSEALPFARALQANLSADANVAVWDQGIFEPGAYALESLIKAVRNSDLGVFVLAADDIVISRGKRQQHSVRDNVLIELGLFLGALGRDRVVAALPSNIDVRLPSDLHGLALVRFPTNRPDKNLQAALGPAATAIRSKIESAAAPEDYPVPAEFTLPLYAVSDSMGRRQRMLLEVITTFQRVNNALLRERFPTFTQPELHYRLECLRLLSFIQRVGGTPASPQTFEYALHPKYIAERSELGLDPHQPDTSFGGLDDVPNLPTRYDSDVIPKDATGSERPKE